MSGAVKNDPEVTIKMPRTEAMLCLDVLRRQAGVFLNAQNEFAASACTMLSERLYEATHAPPKTRHERLSEDDTP